MDSAQMNAMGRKYPFGQKMKRRGHFHIGAHNTKYILPVCTQKVKHICTKIKETSGNFPAIWQTPGRAFSLTTEKPHDKIQNISSAGVVELVDSVDLGSSGIAVQVRVLSPKKGQAVWLVLFSVKSTFWVGEIPLRGVKSGLRPGEIARQCFIKPR